jgi:nuclear transport factor 2 (NTF2) superfamily protein
MMKRNDKGYGWKKDSTPKGNRRPYLKILEGMKLVDTGFDWAEVYADREEDAEFLKWLLANRECRIGFASLYGITGDSWSYYTAYGESYQYVLRNGILRVFNNNKHVNMLDAEEVARWKVTWRGFNVSKSTGIV